MENRFEVVKGAVEVQNDSVAVSQLRRRLAHGLWVAPAVAAVSLPVHAQTSEVSASSDDAASGTRAGTGNELPPTLAKIGFGVRGTRQSSCGTKGGTISGCQKTSCIPAINEGEEPFTISQIEIENPDDFVLVHGRLPVILQPGDTFEICHEFVTPYTGPANDIPRDDEVTVTLSDGTTVVAATTGGGGRDRDRDDEEEVG